MGLPKTCQDCETAISINATRCRSCAVKALWKNPQYRERISATQKAGWDSELRKKMSDIQKALRADPASVFNSEEYRKKMSESVNASECYRKNVERGKARWEDPEFREKMSAQSKANWEDPEYRQRCSDASRARWQDLEFYQKMSGENASGWRGGPAPYGPEWTLALKRKIRERDGCICAICGEGGRAVHHINYDKMDNRHENLIILCQRDHSVANFNREYWQAILSPIAMARACGPSLESAKEELEGKIVDRLMEVGKRYGFK